MKKTNEKVAWVSGIRGLSIIGIVLYHWFSFFNAVGFFLLAVNLNNFLSQNLSLKKILVLAGDHSLPVFLLHAPLIPLVYYSFKNAGMNVVLMLLITYLALVGVAALFFDRIFLYGNPLTKKYFGATPR